MLVTLFCEHVLHLALNSCPAFVDQPKGYKPSGSPQTKWSTSHMSSQVPPHVVNAYKAIEASGQEPMAKLQSAIRLFSQHGLAWEAKITPGQVLCPASSMAKAWLLLWPVSQPPSRSNLIRTTSWWKPARACLHHAKAQKDTSVLPAATLWLGAGLSKPAAKAVMGKSCPWMPCLLASQQMTHSGSFAKKAGSGQFLMPTWNSNSQALLHGFK